jgi:hypothetical protein
MSAAEENLWGDLPLKDIGGTPSSLLRKQADVLSKLTDGLLVGRVTNAPVKMGGEPMMQNSFAIVAPALSNYSVDVLRLYHPPVLYPAKIRGVLGLEPLVEVEDEKALRAELKKIFQSDEVRRVVRSLIAQINEEKASKSD